MWKSSCKYVISDGNRKKRSGIWEAARKSRSLLRLNCCLLFRERRFLLPPRGRRPRCGRCGRCGGGPEGPSGLPIHWQNTRHAMMSQMNKFTHTDTWGRTGEKTHMTNHSICYRSHSVVLSLDSDHSCWIKYHFSTMGGLDPTLASYSIVPCATAWQRQRSTYSMSYLSTAEFAVKAATAGRNGPGEVLSMLTPEKKHTHTDTHLSMVWVAVFLYVLKLIILDLFHPSNEL